MKKSVRPTTRSGFSLIIMSILLTVGALILASLLPGRESGNYFQQSMSSVQKLQKVEDAMKSFMANNGRRPCPADGQYTTGSPYFGIEAANPGTCTGGTPAAPLGPTTNYIVGGVIPTKTLGLPDNYAFDEWGRRFTYMVDLRATLLATCRTLQGITAMSNGAGVGGINITTTTTSGALTSVATGGTLIDQTMVAYVSHGPDGHGAWPAQGSATTLTTAQSDAMRINAYSTDTDTLTNASENSNYTVNFTNQRVRKEKTTTFDDIVYYTDYLKNTCCVGPLCTPLGIRIDGTQNSAYTGYSVAVGDVNGDGIPDLIIGDSQASNNLLSGTNDGVVYVVFGTKLGFTTDPLSLGALNGTNGFMINGPAGAHGQAGMSVATGDINGDGVSDIIINVPAANSNMGTTYVVFGHAYGNAWPSTLLLDSIPCNSASPTTSTIGFCFQGNFTSAGQSVAAGDLNGAVNASGYNRNIDDLVVGSASAAGIGAAYIVFGSSTTTAWPTPVTVSQLNGTVGTVVTSGASGDYFGYAVATGNVHGNNVSGNTGIITDLAIGAPYIGNAQAGSVYVLFGKQTGWTAATSVASLGGTAGNDGFKLLDAHTSAATASQFGQSLAVADVNGDGIADLVIGIPNATYLDVVYGKTTGWSGSNSINTAYFDGYTTGFEVNEPASSSNFGTAVAAGDINGDGMADVIISSTATANGRSTAGIHYVIFGTALTRGSTPIYPYSDGVNGFQIWGPVAGANSGGHMAFTSGKINGYGVSNLIIGDPYVIDGLAAYGGSTNAGSTYVVYGRASWSNLGTVDLNNIQ